MPELPFDDICLCDTPETCPGAKPSARLLRVPTATNHASSRSLYPVRRIRPSMSTCEATRPMFRCGFVLPAISASPSRLMTKAGIQTIGTGRKRTPL